MALENKKLIKKSGLYLIGNFSSKILASLLLPVYAVYVTAAELGTYDMIYTVCSMIIPVVFFCMWEATLRYVLKADEEEKIKYTSTLLCFLCIDTVLILFGAVLGKNILRISYKYYYEVVAYIVVFGCAQVLQALARAIKKNGIYVISGVASTAVNFLCVVLFVCLFQKGTAGLLWAAIIGQTSVVVITALGVHIWRCFDLKLFDQKLLRRMLVFTIPLVLNQAVSWLISSFSKVVINIHIGVVSNGQYSFASKFSVLVTMVGSVVSMALFEEAVLASGNIEFGEKYGKAVNNLNRMFFTVITVAFPAICIFYYLFAGKDYMPSKFLVPILLVYAILMNFSTNIGSVFQVIDKTKYQFITTMIGAIVSCGLSYVLVFKFSIYGVVIGQLFGAVAMVLSRYLFVEKYIHLSIDFREFFLMTFIFALVSIICAKTSIVLNFFFFVLSSSVALYLNRAMIGSVYNRIKK